MITLQCKLKPEDYIQAQYLHMRPSPLFKYLCIALLSLCLVVFIASASSLGSLTIALSGFDPISIFFLNLCIYFYILYYALEHSSSISTAKDASR